jgi:nardilysin
MSQVQVLETPIKSEKDKKNYRLIKLQNGLKALLIQKTDEESDEIAAITLAVKVGSFDDPKKAMGLAHFLEHIVMMGSQKYPGESSFNEFLTAHGGRDNAMTSAQFTAYYFKITEKVFPEALDIFANQFIAPLLSKDAMQREREAVDSEFQMATSSNNLLHESIIKTLTNENHSGSQFDCGNLKTLKEDISDDELHSELFKLFDKYVGNKMYVAIQSKKSLDDLQELVEKSFSAVKSGNDEEMPKPMTVEEIFKPEFFSKMIFMKPKTVEKSLSITWALPSIQKLYKVAPFEFISSIIENQGDGGLEIYLKEKQLITNLSFYVLSNASSGNSQFCRPELYMALTDEGTEKVDEILEAIFSYLLMIKEASIEELKRIYNDLKSDDELNFKFHSEIDTLKNTTNLALNMLLYDDIDIIRSTSMTYFGFDEVVITNAINQLNERKFNLLIMNGSHGHFPNKSKFFEAEFDEIEFPEQYQKLWDDRKPNPAFFLEKPNPFKATNFEIFVNEEESQVIFLLLKAGGS